MSNIKNHHDRYFRGSMANPTVVREFLEQHLPANVRDFIDLSDFHLCPQSFVEKDLKNKISDVIVEAKLQHCEQSDCLVYILIEHQRKPERFMPLRLLRYMVNVLEYYHQQHKDRKLPFIYPMVFYNGKAEYPYSLDLRDLIAAPISLINDVYARPFHLVDLNSISDELIREHAWLGMMEFLMKHRPAQQFQYFLQGVVDIVQKLDKRPDADQALIDMSLNYLVYVTKAVDFEDLLNKIQQNVSPEMEVFMSDKLDILSRWAHERGMKKGIEAGREIGIKKGIEEGIEEGIAKGIEQGIERGIEQGIERGIERGIEQGIERGIEQGIERGLRRGSSQAKHEMIQKLSKLGVKPEQLAQATGIELSAVERIIEPSKISTA